MQKQMQWPWLEFEFCMWIPFFMLIIAMLMCTFDVCNWNFNFRPTKFLMFNVDYLLFLDLYFQKGLNTVILDCSSHWWIVFMFSFLKTRCKWDLLLVSVPNKSLVISKNFKFLKFLPSEPLWHWIYKSWRTKITNMKFVKVNKFNLILKFITFQFLIWAICLFIGTKFS